MGDPKGFLKTARETPRRRPVDVRLTDWREVYEPFARERAERQAARCMDCGIPFCHNGCPLARERLVHLAPVAQPHVHRPPPRGLPRGLQEPLRVTHD